MEWQYLLLAEVKDLSGEISDVRMRISLKPQNTSAKAKGDLGSTSDAQQTVEFIVRAPAVVEDLG